MTLKEDFVGFDAWLSVGGDYRFRFDSYVAPDFGRPGGVDYTAIENRFLVHANVDWKDRLRAFVQICRGLPDFFRAVPMST